MTDILRSSEASWHGDLRTGKGMITSGSDVLKDTPYTFVTRFEDNSGSNPEELLAAAHAACFSMALANLLSRKEHFVHHVRTRATVVLTKEATGSTITKITLETFGKVEDVAADAFKTAAEETMRTCIVSQALSAIPMEVTATLE